MNAKMSPSEKIVTGLAIAVVIAGFASGVFAKPAGTGPHGVSPAVHVSASQVHREPAR
ncbi:hypothetical protein SAMN05444161_5181 [Rhizobiales bacterium GAS191]|jgi:hypothetical protein|nr:hypothetical protein SAMN05519103_04446 [Rhizobiales bacterium GAS113]SEE22778.1 hypothetical protein SAMN05444161_5181 [Rhizobiales bacterium GAS191]SEE33463.1 hypothetical protein SAMN05519104_5807 [Rhizobiales bacterium GAS188]